MLSPRLGFFWGGDGSFIKEFFSLISATANYSLPEKNDYLDEVIYGELTKEEAQPLVTKYKEEARKLLPPSEKRANRRNNRNKRNRQNRNRGQGYGEAPTGRREPGGADPGTGLACSVCAWHLPPCPNSNGNSSFVPQNGFGALRFHHSGDFSFCGGISQALALSQPFGLV